MPNLPDELTNLAEADRHIAEAEARINAMVAEPLLSAEGVRLLMHMQCAAC